jgi:hypothetical protein
MVGFSVACADVKAKRPPMIAVQAAVKVASLLAGRERVDM